MRERKWCVSPAMSGGFPSRNCLRRCCTGETPWHTTVILGKLLPETLQIREILGAAGGAFVSYQLLSPEKANRN